MSPHNIDKDLNEEFKDIQEYINMIFNGTLYNPNEVFKKSENPKITIVISVYNGEAYLETALLSIQNQDFKDIEIIMVDDCSKDDSVNLIKKKW
jgi:cellulose synthase/poly-beta-1,6-N-acetylglucosamine synthase-like glycosyltransferase